MIRATGRTDHLARRVGRSLVLIAIGCAAVAAPSACNRRGSEQPAYRTFKTPEDAVRTLGDAVKAKKPDELMAIFGPGAQEIVDTTDPTASRRNLEVFAAAMAEQWKLLDAGNGAKTLIVGNEAWPFPIPLVKGETGWRFDTAAGKEEVIARRIGRNELAAIQICRTYVAAQHVYAEAGHDGRPAKVYARTFRSDPGRQNGLYWAVARGQKRSPLGDLVAYAAEEGTPLDKNDAQPTPFHGYYFRILTAQGAAAAGGARDYVVQDKMSGGFALVAWPAQYDTTGVMTFIVNQDGIIRQKDLGPESHTQAQAITVYNPDASWEIVQ
jgi:hypothetical protein